MEDSLFFRIAKRLSVVCFVLSLPIILFFLFFAPWISAIIVIVMVVNIVASKCDGVLAIVLMVVATIGSIFNILMVLMLFGALTRTRGYFPNWMIIFLLAMSFVPILNIIAIIEAHINFKQEAK